MKRYNEKYIPDVGKCFCINNQRYSLCYSGFEDFEEVELDTTDIKRLIKNVYKIDNKIAIDISGNAKKKLINVLFSNDDELAIILNYQDSKTIENKEIYNLLQGWRKCFSNIIKKCREIEDEQ